jgi:hypothetical protein
MDLPVKLNLKIYQGSTFSKTLRWESNTKKYISISEITKAAPMVVTANNHGVPQGWRCKFTNLTSMKELLATEYFTNTAITTNTLTFNQVNSLGYSAYTSGGILEYNQPIDLTGITARMQIREKLTSENSILELSTQNGLIQIDNTLKTITFSIPATITQDLSFKQAVYSLEIVKGTTVIPFITGTVSLTLEVTR